MAIVYDNNKVVLESVIYEDEVINLRDFLKEKAPENISFDFKSCDDVHLAVLQLILAYKKMYAAEYSLGDEKIYHKVLHGFDISEDNCN